MPKIPAAKLDLYLFNAINGLAKKSRALDFFAVFFAQYLGYVLVISLAVLAIFSHSWQLFFVPVIAGDIARFFINEIIYFFYKRKRPMEVLAIIALVKKPWHPAFPSGHAAFFFALSFALLLFNFPLAIIFIVASFCISVARIFCGAHWPSDILGGISSASTSLLVVYLVMIML